MTQHRGNIDDFGMDTISLAGTLPAKLRAMRDAGFSQVMLNARDLVAIRRACTMRCARSSAAACASPASRCCATSKAWPAICTTTRSTSPSRCSRCARAVGAPLLLACSSTQHARHAGSSTRWRATCASWRCWRCRSASRSPTRACRGAARSTSSPTAWDVVSRADAPNLGMGIDSFHIVRRQDAAGRPRHARPRQDLPRAAGRLHVARDPFVRGAHRHRAPLPRVPGRGRAQRRRSPSWCIRLDALGYRGDYSFEVFNDDYQQMPPATVAERARRSAVWLGEEVLRRSVPLPGAMRLKGRAAPAAS